MFFIFFFSFLPKPMYSVDRGIIFPERFPLMVDKA